MQQGAANPDQTDCKETAKPSQFAWRRAPQLLCISAATAGTVVLLGACLYRRVRHPEWTGGQALEALWPIYLAGASSICVGWLFSDAKSK